MSQTQALFDLTLTEEQSIARDSARRFAEQQMRAISRSADEAKQAPAGFYDKTMELGLTLLPIPEALGGVGGERSPISNILTAEDLGKGDMSLAIGALMPLSVVNTLLDQGSQAQQQKYLPLFASDNFRPATLALMEPQILFEPSQLTTTAHKEGDHYILNGVKTMVALGESAELIIVVANIVGEGIGAFIIEKGIPGISFTQEEHMGLRPLELRRLTLDKVRLPASAKLGENEKSFNLERLLDLSRLGVCALAVGVCEAVLDYVSKYVNERIAFGEPISYRQAVAFMVANIAIELEGMRMMIYRAAARAEQGLAFHREAYLARIFCAEKAMEIGTNGVHLLGGHGFIREHMVELWFRNLRAVGILEGVVVI